VIRALKALLLKFQLFRDIREGRTQRLRMASRSFPIFLDYPPQPVPRYGYGKPPHGGLSEILNRKRQEYAQTLTEFLLFKADLQKIPLDKPDEPRAPYWLNQYFMGIDAVSLYAFTCLRNPSRCIEIGSGNSTKFIRRAIDDHALRTRILSIDPQPRVEIDDLCDEIRREPLEETDLRVFDDLAAGDIVLMDVSHRVFTNSDTTVFFLDVLPRLRAGVLVYIDDIFLPFDYPPAWTSRYYSEQYLLSVLLLADSPRYEVRLPCVFIGHDPDLMKLLDPLWKDGPISGAATSGNGFWLAIC